MEFFSKYLPADLAASLDLPTLQLTGTSFVNDQLKEFFSDLVFTCRKKEGKEITIPLILEHKSYAPPYPPLQIMQYQMNGWQAQINDKKKPTPIIPVIFYHGRKEWRQRPWKDYLQGMEASFELYTPAGEYVFIDLSNMADAEITAFRSAFMKTVMLVMKHRYEQEYLLNNLDQIFIFVENDEDFQNNQSSVSLVLLYLKETINLTWSQFEARMRNLPKIKKAAMTVYEDILEKGMEKGIEITTSVQLLIKSRPDISDEEIALIEGISMELVKKIRRHLARTSQGKNGK